MMNKRELANLSWKRRLFRSDQPVDKLITPSKITLQPVR